MVVVVVQCRHPLRVAWPDSEEREGTFACVRNACAAKCIQRAAGGRPLQGLGAPAVAAARLVLR